MGRARVAGFLDGLVLFGNKCMIQLRNELVLEPVGNRLSEKQLTDFEARTQLGLPASYRGFLKKMNGAFLRPCSIKSGQEKGMGVRSLYGINPSEPAHDLLESYTHFETHIPWGLIMIGDTGQECEDFCLDLRRYAGRSVYKGMRKMLFGNELADITKVAIPVKMYRWHRFWSTGKFSESDLTLVANSFEEFISLVQLDDDE
jgi:hypothetical protein